MSMTAKNWVICTLLALSMLGCKQGGSSSTAAAAPQSTPQAKPVSQPALDAEPQGPALHIDSTRAMEYTREIVALGPRWPGSKGQEKVANYLRNRLKADHVEVEEDAFTADTPAGKLPMRNFVAKFQGTKDGVIILSSHIDTNYPLRNTTYIGANDGASTTALLLAIADQLRGRKVEGYSVWLAFLDGEEAIDHWTSTDSVYGSRHLADKWQQDGTIPKIKGFLVADMLGDADLDILRDQNSTPWLEDLVLKAAQRLGYQSHFFPYQSAVEDDHLPFSRMGVPVADIIDLDYGYNNSYHHTPQDTMDKLSPRSLQISGDVILETIRLLNANSDKLFATSK
jgi:aminopeptidase-like protein